MLAAPRPAPPLPTPPRQATPPTSPSKFVAGFISPRRKRRPQPLKSASPTPGSPESKSSQLSPRSQRSPRSLTFPHVVDMFVRLRRLQKKATGNRVESASGTDPITHPELSDQPDIQLRARITVEDNFLCSGGVDVAKLLRATRSLLLDGGLAINANALLDEMWTVSINGRGDGTFKVSVHYTACAARSPKRDPHRPVAAQQARGVPGLMTILARDTLPLRAEAPHDA